MNKSVNHKSAYPRQNKNDEIDDMNMIAQLSLQAAKNLAQESGGSTKIVRSDDFVDGFGDERAVFSRATSSGDKAESSGATGGFGTRADTSSASVGGSRDKVESSGATDTSSARVNSSGATGGFGTRADTSSASVGGSRDKVESSGATGVSSASVKSSGTRANASSSRVNSSSAVKSNSTNEALSSSKRISPSTNATKTFDSKIVRADFLSEDDNSDGNLRPLSLNEFLGQSSIKENLAVFINAAKERNEALDHLFLIGPPGLGKTTLAQITANELGVDFKVTSAPALDKPKDLAGILSTITPRTVFFIDEIHRLKPAIEEMLYIAMEDFELDWVIGQGAAARTVRIPIPHFTLVGATTKAGMVSKPLQTRFGIIQRLQFYTPEELSLIIKRSAKILNVKIDDDASILLAKCSRGTPRVTNRLVRRMRDFAQVENSSKITVEIVKRGLEKLGIDNFGLEYYDREILLSIINNFGGGPVGAETLAISIGESVDTLEDYYEPYLIQCGLLQRTPRGRIVTARAYEHLGLDLSKNNQSQQINFNFFENKL